jgi:hypothetical protein
MMAADNKQAVLTRTKKVDMTITDLTNAVRFLRRLMVGQMEVDQLIKTVQALEAEIEKRKKKK